MVDWMLVEKVMVKYIHRVKTEINGMRYLGSFCCSVRSKVDGHMDSNEWGMK